MLSTLRLFSTRIDRTFTTPLTPEVRRNMYIELLASVAYGIFYAAAIQYIPVVLRRLGASSDLLALYTAQTYLGSILTSLSIVLMRRRRPKNFVTLCWLLARSLFLLFALVTQVHWLLVVTAFFWLLEAFPSPGYTRIIQVIYPERVRGQILSVVRLGMVSAILLATPFAGWALDQASVPRCSLANYASMRGRCRRVKPARCRASGNWRAIIAPLPCICSPLLSMAWAAYWAIRSMRLSRWIDSSFRTLRLASWGWANRWLGWSAF